MNGRAMNGWMGLLRVEGYVTFAFEEGDAVVYTCRCKPAGKACKEVRITIRSLPYFISPRFSHPHHPIDINERISQVCLTVIEANNIIFWQETNVKKVLENLFVLTRCHFSQIKQFRILPIITSSISIAVYPYL